MYVSKSQLHCTPRRTCRPLKTRPVSRRARASTRGADGFLVPHIQIPRKIRSGIRSGDTSVLRALLPWFPKGTKEIRYGEQRFIFTSVRPLRVSVRVLCAALPTLKKRPRPWPRVFPQTVTLPRSSSLPVGSFSASGSVSSSSQGHCEIYTW